MMKRIFCLLILLLVCAAAPSLAEYETMVIEDYFIEADLENKTAVILSYEGISENLVIPDILGRYRVTGVSGLGFKVDLKSIVISEGVEELREGAISSGKQLTYVSLPDSLVTLTGNPFKDCSALTDLRISENHPALELVDGVLYSKTEKRLIACLRAMNKEHVSVRPGTVSIGDHAFYICKSLKSIEIPDGVASIGRNAFYHCNQLKSLDLPKSLRTIGDCAFMYCEAMTFAQLPDRMDHIGKGAFDNCRKLPNIQVYENDEAPEYDPAVIPEMGSTYTEQYCEENGLDYIYLLANRPW